MTFKDFLGQTVTTIGRVSESPLQYEDWENLYLTIDSQQFEVSAIQYYGVKEGDQVHLTYWPNTRIVASLEKLEASEETGTEQELSPQQNPPVGDQRPAN